MKKQNVLFSAEKNVSSSTLALTTIMSKSSSSSQAPVMQPSNSINSAITRKSLLKQLETESGSSAWVETMKASSPPTHTDFSQSEEHRSWMAQHPSALNMFQQIIEASQGKKIVVFLDYDGTLSPIVPDPDKAYMSKHMRAAVRDVAKFFPTAIISGRCRDQVYSFVRLAGLYYAGSHGMDIRGPTEGAKKSNDQGLLFQPPSEFLPVIDEVNKVLIEKTKSIDGAKVENNKFCVSVHYRNVDEKQWNLIAETVGSVLKGYPELKLTHGRKVLEIRPTIEWDKGKALEFLLDYLGFRNTNDVLPLYIGDDRTDEDAFKVLRERGQGFGILVSKSPKETNASYSLREPAEVMDFLHLLVDWKKLSNSR
ncbi:hypothetical protein MKX03_010283 [Papaver bracteatum]|nr:hypothetical protein MKX03_010283 [Papaver bracteatum]